MRTGNTEQKLRVRDYSLDRQFSYKTAKLFMLPTCLIQDGDTGTTVTCGLLI